MVTIENLLIDNLPVISLQKYCQNKAYNINMKVLPTTQLGKWSVGFLATTIGLFIFTSFVVVGLFKQVGGDTLTDNLFISIPMILAAGLAIMGLITGLISVWRYKERSLLIAVPIVVGLIITLFLLGEIATPH